MVNNPSPNGKKEENKQIITFRLSAFKRLGVEKACRKPTPYRSKTYKRKGETKISYQNIIKDLVHIAEEKMFSKEQGEVDDEH